MTNTADFATLADVKQLCALEQASFDTDLLSAAQYRAFIKKPSADVLVIRHDNIIIASAIILYRKNSTLARLYSIAVNQAFHGKQIASQLLSAIEHCASERRCTQIRLEVSVNNKRAIHFYQKNHYQNFATIHQYYENGDDAIRMCKQL